MNSEDLGRSENPDGVDLTEVYTLANAITLARLFLVPVFFALLLKGGEDMTAFAVFVVAASTDWLDGQIARRTHTVSVIGRAIDPVVDRLLIAAGVVGLYLVDRLPLWIMIVLILRDALLLTGAWVLEKQHRKRLDVVFLGKVATAVLLTGFSLLLLNWPFVPGLGVVQSAALPGWGTSEAPLGIWVVYVGTILSLTTAGIYLREFNRVVSDK